jgi:hypothetical protein
LGTPPVLIFRLTARSDATNVTVSISLRLHPWYRAINTLSHRTPHTAGERKRPKCLRRRRFLYSIPQAQGRFDSRERKVLPFSKAVGFDRAEAGAETEKVSGMLPAVQKWSTERNPRKSAESA